MGNRKRIAVIFGGQSSEHEVSRVSAESVLRNIDKNKYDIEMIGITKDGRWLPYNGPLELVGTGAWQSLAEKSLLSIGTASSAAGLLNQTDRNDAGKKIDVIFPVLHGCNGEDGTIQGLFELAGVPYVGCGVLGSALGMDKGFAKIIFEKEGIPQGKYLVFSRTRLDQELEEIVNRVEAALSYPCFVKPSNAGSSVGVSKARNRGELIAALQLAAKYDRRMLVEEFIDGREIECAVLGNEDPIASSVGEVVPCNDFYDYDAKYNRGDSSTVIIPADLPAAAVEMIKEYAVRAFKALDLSGLSRVDFFVDKNSGEVYINEVNTLPGFTSISMYPKLWAASGIPYPELIDRLLQLAIERFDETRRQI